MLLLLPGVNVINLSLWHLFEDILGEELHEEDEDREDDPKNDESQGGLNKDSSLK